MTLTGADRRIISLVSGDLPENPAPYAEIAARLGIPEKELLNRIEEFRHGGVLRRFGASLNHRRIGFEANAMAVWRVPEQKVEEMAKKLAARREVTHCYERESRPGWPYNLYAMLHARTREQCEKIAAKISGAVGMDDYNLLFTIREFKKRGPAYVDSGDPG
jgi:DNA-binding Lrp family transcriptional regulator